MEPMKFVGTIPEFEKKMKELAREHGLIYDSTYMYYCNGICPCCYGEMVVEDGTIQNVGSISVGMMGNVIIPYAICELCTEYLETKTESEKEEKADQVLKYVILKMASIDI
ncbi:hypothetical protein [Bacillus cereus group sp. Bce015]|uniref:hypothetical protein n=1 Tax=Bacillus cereus group sp. Bce015 TaxID=3445249 RepID=UPI003F6A1025